MRLDAPRILICRLSAIGDCILTVPMLCALRAALPHAYLAWITQPSAAPLLREHACLDRLIVVPKGFLKSPQKVLQLRRELRELAFDVVLDPQSLTKSAIPGWLSGAPQRIGFDRPRGRELSLWLNNCLIRPTQTHLVDAQLELLAPFGIHAPAVRFDLPRNQAAEEQVERILAMLHLGCPFAVFNVGGGWESRLWPTTHFGRLARLLGESRRIPSLVVWAGEREKSWGEEVVANSGGHALLAPPTSLPELQAILRRACVCASSDTGPMHLAAAVGTPCVGMFGPTRAEQSGPYGPQHVRLQKWYQNGSSRERRRASNEAMRAISPEMAFEACLQVLDHKPSESHAASRAA